MNVLVLGSGGREHALAWAIAKSPRLDSLFVAPGNGGTATIAKNVPLDMNDADAVIGFARGIRPWCAGCAPRRLQKLLEGIYAGPWTSHGALQKVHVAG